MEYDKKDKLWFRIAGMRFWTVLSVLFFLFGCTAHSPPPFQELTAAIEYGDPPRSVAVLPFINNTEIQGIEKEFRRGIFRHMAVHPYRDVELFEIDALLNENSLRENYAFAKVSIKELGRILRCDAVIMGEVDDFYQIFLGIYSQMTIKGTVTIWDTRSGNKIWTDAQSVSKREGGVPLGFYDVPLISVRSGFNLRNSIREDLVKDLSQFLVSRIPAPACFVYKEDSEVRYAYELQVGAYIEKEYALQLQKLLKEKGYPAYIRSNWDDRGLWHRVFLGMYEDKEAAVRMQDEIREHIGTQPVIARFIVTDPSHGERLE